MRPLVWEVMDKADGDADALRAIAHEATQEQLILLCNRVSSVAWGLTRPVLPHVPEGEVRRTVGWLVSQGEKAVYDAHRDPSAVKPAPEDVMDPERVLRAVYKERFGGTPPLDEPDPVGTLELTVQPEWEEAFESLLPLHHEAGVPVKDLIARWTRSELLLLHTAGRQNTDERSAAVLQGIASEYLERYDRRVP